jgi:hypothetical protein
MPDALAIDVLCSRCRYHLYGLDPASACPECGQPIAQTLAVGLENAPPDWLARQAEAMLWLVAVGLAAVPASQYAVFFSPLLLVLLVLPVAVAIARGCWLLATPERPETVDTTQGTLLRALRVIPIIYAATVPVTYGLIPPGALDRRLWGLVDLVAMGAMLFTVWAVSFFIARLARRTFDRTLVTHATIVLWALPTSTLLKYAVPPMMAALRRDNFDYPRSPAMILWTLLNWLSVAAAFATVLLLGRMHEALRAAARRAAPILDAEPLNPAAPEA